MSTQSCASAPSVGDKTPTRQSFFNNTGAARFHLSERKTRSTNGIWFLTERSIRKWRVRASVLRHSPRSVRDILAQRWVLDQEHL